MKHQLMMCAVGALALGVSGVAIAEGTDKNKPQQEQTWQQNQPGVEGQQQQGQEGMQQGQQGMQQGQQKVGVNRLQSIKLDTLDQQALTQVQQKLSDLGYYKGEIDGIMGSKTRGALNQFFTDQSRLLTQGRLSETGMMALGFDNTEIERVRGIEQEGDQSQRAPTGGVDQPESGEVYQPGDLGQPSQPSEPVQPTEPSQPAQPTEPSQPSEPTEPTPEGY